MRHLRVDLSYYNNGGKILENPAWLAKYLYLMGLSSEYSDD
jgi:hypothetical protein